jgi:hypothetical protein
MTVTADLFQLLQPTVWGVIVPDAFGPVLEHAVGLSQRVAVALIGPGDNGVGIGPMGDDEDLTPPNHRIVSPKSNHQITRKRSVDAQSMTSLPRLSWIRQWTVPSMIQVHGQEAEHSSQKYGYKRKIISKYGVGQNN